MHFKMRQDFFFFNFNLFSLPISDENIWFSQNPQEGTLNQSLLTGRGSSCVLMIWSWSSPHWCFSHITFNSDSIDSSQGSSLLTSFPSLHLFAAGFLRSFLPVEYPFQSLLKRWGLEQPQFVAIAMAKVSPPSWGRSGYWDILF